MRLYYSHNLNPRVAVAVARHLDSPLDFIRASPFRPDQIESFRKMNPNTRVPVLVEGEKSLWETDAIACRLSEISGSDFWRRDAEMPEMVRWISWGTHHLTRAADPLYFERVVRPLYMKGSIPKDPKELEEPLQEFRQFAAILDAYLKDKEWLLESGLSYADFRAATSLPFAAQAGLPAQDFPNVQRWHGQLLRLPAWREPFEGLA
ncbi:MAG TPA: glutathione S-transferase family protein [Gammaproteobacteria bacterium]|nr:glutathione S-transferase family protein [Gammaproteobacteria bacterium]